MSNNTTCSSPHNFSIYCGVNYGKKEYDSYVNASTASYIIIVILSPVAVAGNTLILAAT